MLMECDKCLSKIDYDKDEVYHATGMVDGALNRHLHLCESCYKKTFKDFVTIEKIEEDKGKMKYTAHKLAPI